MTTWPNGALAAVALSIAVISPALTTAQPLSTVPSDRLDELRAGVDLVLNELGRIDPSQAASLEQAVRRATEGEEIPSKATIAIQTVLDRACLLEVGINPESRVKVSPGPAPRELVAGEWRAFLVKVHNLAGVTAPIRVSSPNAAQSDKRNDRDTWLEIEMVDGNALEEELSGGLIEYRIVRLRTEAVGDRAALVAMDVGQGTADIGFRNDTVLLFRCLQAERSGDEETPEGKLLRALPDRDPELPLARLIGLTVDDDTGTPIPSRVYLTNKRGQQFTLRSLEGGAAAYRREPAHLPRSREVHTAVPAAPFYTELPAGEYRLVAEKGKEYASTATTVRVAADDRAVVLRLQRFANMARDGWYSGDVHVHRAVADLPAAMRADDLNVAFAIQQWVEDATTRPNELPATNRPRVEMVDPQHAISHQNTEYEVISVANEDVALGSLIVLDHGRPLASPALPLAAVGHEVELAGGLIDLDKHNWPWSLVAAPAARANLFELANNHLWRTEFGFPAFNTDSAANYMRLQRDSRGLTEEGWIHYGFEAYYALLNCGLDLKTSAGSASGVHPTPLGFGRVYARIDGPFTFDKWRDSLAAGRSFATTGPLLKATFNGLDPGARFDGRVAGSVFKLEVAATVFSEHPLERVELIQDGLVVESYEPTSESQQRPLDVSFVANHASHRTSWYAVRAFARRERGRLTFAHTSPVYVDYPNSPLSPRPEQVDWLIECVRTSLRTHHHLLTPEAREEFRNAIAFYQSVAAKSRLAQRTSN